MCCLGYIYKHIFTVQENDLVLETNYTGCVAWDIYKHIFTVQENDLVLETNYAGYVAWGEYPFAFAACLEQEECYRQLYCPFSYTFSLLPLSPLPPPPFHSSFSHSFFLLITFVPLSSYFLISHFFRFLNYFTPFFPLSRFFSTCPPLCTPPFHPLTSHSFLLFLIWVSLHSIFPLPCPLFLFPSALLPQFFFPSIASFRSTSLLFFPSFPFHPLIHFLPINLLLLQYLKKIL